MILDKTSRHAGHMDILMQTVYWMKEHNADYAEFNSLVNWFEEYGYISDMDNVLLQAHWAVVVEGRDIAEVL